MKNKNVSRYACIMLLGVIMNLLFYNIAHFLHLPAWLDNIGTAYAAFALEPAAGLLVAFATSFYEAAEIYDSSSLVYYATSAAFALSAGICMRRSGKIVWKRMLIMLPVMFVSTTCIASLITIWRTGGLPDSGWERYFYDIMFARTASPAISCFFGTGVLKLADSAAIGVLLPILYLIIPRRFINQENPQIVSWQTPYFQKKSQKG